MKLSEEEQNKAWKVVGGIMIITLFILLASIFNLVPAGWNIFEQIQGEDAPMLIAGEGYIDGFPDEVNVTVQLNNSYPITFVCNESYIAEMQLTITLGVDLTNTTVYWTATSTDWQIDDDQLVAEYVGDPLSTGVELDSLVLHVDGGDEAGDFEIETITGTGTLLPDEVTIDVIV